MRAPARLAAPVVAVLLGGAAAGEDAAPPALDPAATLQSARDGADWLAKQQTPDGRFRYGWLPALNRPLPGDHALRQAGSAAICARAGAQFDESAWTSAGRKAVERLLSIGTEIDPQNADVRRPTLPPHDANPVGFAALLLWAIEELEPADPTLTAEADRLARFLVSRHRADGSLNVSAALRADGEDGLVAPAFYPGEALFALMRSHQRRPTAWKLAAVEKAFPYYRHWFRAHPHEAFPPWMCLAYDAAFAATKNRAYAAFVCEAADWCLALQHVSPRDAERGWEGGFGSFQEGQWLATEPGITAASFCEGLAAAHRTATAVGDRTRAKRYADALHRGIRFTMGLQYTPARTGHFNPEYARGLHGGFAAGLSEGSLRIDQNQHAVHALLLYRETLAPMPAPRAN